MKKRAITKLFLYRYRFKIGYILLALAFFGFIFFLPSITPDGLSEAEKQSVVTSYNLHFSSITGGDLVDLPYHIIQKISILLLGMNNYAIKLPSILIAIALGFLIVLLLNRWFKNNVALLASIMTVLSIPFLYLAGSGTPLIMLVFWPTLLLWLGSKIQGEKRPNPVFCFIFALVLLLSVYTPHMVFLDLFIVLYAFLNPHLRFTIKNLPRLPFVITCIFIALGLGMLVINLISRPEITRELLFSSNFASGNFLENLRLAFAPVFSWGSTIEGVFLTPIIGLPVLFLACLGLLATVGGLRASRNFIALIFIFFTAILCGFNPDAIVLVILPLSILIAHGLKYILEKWYGLFPENPYARVFGIFPISIFVLIIIFSGISDFIFGYRYTPAVSRSFDNDLDLVAAHLDDSVTVVAIPGSLTYDFYEVYEDRTHNIDLAAEMNNVSTDSVAILTDANVSIDKNKWSLSRIITSPKSDNSDRIYIYKKK